MDGYHSKALRNVSLFLVPTVCCSKDILVGKLMGGGLVEMAREFLNFRFGGWLGRCSGAGWWRICIL